MKKIFLLGFVLSFASMNSICQASAPLLQVSESLKNGMQTIFISPTTTFHRSTLMLDTFVDGKKVVLEHPSANLWLYPVTEIGGSHTLSFKVSLGNLSKVAQVEASIAAVSQNISDIQTALASATNPSDIANLTAQLNEKQRLKARLEADRENLKNFIGNQNYFFTAN